MGNKRFRVMFDFSRHGCLMALECKRCGHRATIPVTPDLWRWSIYDYVRRLYCSECGSRRVEWGVMPRDAA